MLMRGKVNVFTGVCDSVQGVGYILSRVLSGGDGGRIHPVQVLFGQEGFRHILSCLGGNTLTK